MLADGLFFNEALSRHRIGWIGLAFLGLTILPRFGTMGIDRNWLPAAAFLNPAVALLSDFLVFGRSITLLQAAGLILILVSALGVNLGWPFAVARTRPRSRRA